MNKKMVHESRDCVDRVLVVSDYDTCSKWIGTTSYLKDCLSRMGGIGMRTIPSSYTDKMSSG